VQEPVLEDATEVTMTATEPHIYELDFDSDGKGTVGLWKDGTTWQDGTVAVITVTEEGEKNKKWISDCACFIHAETRSKGGITEFTFVGTGAKDGRAVKFTMLATDCVNTQKFKGQLANAFGSQNLPSGGKG
jgi:hypothetical protein